jgi:hypothetical protein
MPWSSVSLKNLKSSVSLLEERKEVRSFEERERERERDFSGEKMFKEQTQKKRKEGKSQHTGQKWRCTRHSFQPSLFFL